MKRRLLSLLLVLAMVLSMAPVGVFAEEPPAEASTQDSWDDFTNITSMYVQMVDNPARVNVSFHICAEQKQARLVVAAFADGRLLASCEQMVECGEDFVDVYLNDLPEPVLIKAFLLDPDTLEPLCDNGEWTSDGQAPEPIRGEQGDIKWSLDNGYLMIEAQEGAEDAKLGAEDAKLEPKEGGIWAYGWEAYRDQITHVDIYGVTGIAADAFAEYPGLYGVSIKTQVKVKGYLAPVDVTIPVKVVAKAPTLKLDTKQWTISSFGQVETELSITGDTEGLEFAETVTVLDNKGNVLRGYRAACSGNMICLQAKYDYRFSGSTNVKLRLQLVPNDSHAEEGTGSESHGPAGPPFTSPLCSRSNLSNSLKT